VKRLLIALALIGAIMATLALPTMAFADDAPATVVQTSSADSTPPADSTPVESTPAVTQTPADPLAATDVRLIDGHVDWQ